MPHHLTLNKNTGRYEMAFFGALPWHGLGQEVAQGCSIDEMRTDAGLDWHAIESVDMYAVPGSLVDFAHIGESRFFYHNDQQYQMQGDHALHVQSGQ